MWRVNWGITIKDDLQVAVCPVCTRGYVLIELRPEECKALSWTMALMRCPACSECLEFQPLDKLPGARWRYDEQTEL